VVRFDFEAEVKYFGCLKHSGSDLQNKTIDEQNQLLDLAVKQDVMPMMTHET
jgi:hypothetical protein